jgi:hypothetical protein
MPAGKTLDMKSWATAIDLVTRKVMLDKVPLLQSFKLFGGEEVTSGQVQGRSCALEPLQDAPIRRNHRACDALQCSWRTGLLKPLVHWACGVAHL